MNTTASVTPREGMTDLYDKIIEYAYEIRMIEIDEYLHGMNRKEIEVEKAFEIIINAPDCESNAIMNVWKGRLADPNLPDYKSSRVEKNESRAHEYYRKAVDLDIERMAEAGDQHAQACLGVMYHFGRGVDKNKSTAVKWHRKAAEQGHARSQFNLGVIYANGWGVNLNCSTAVEWFRKAAEHGYANAQYYLGFIYEYGYGVDQNDSIAVEWYRKAAEQGHSGSQNNLGRLTT